MKRIVLGLSAVVLATSSCSQRDDQRSSGDLKTFDVQEEASDSSAAPAMRAAPGIVPTAAPGVAFNYRYGFRLPDTNISAAQEAHAEACEKLGLARCRITGMTYELDDRERVDATLALAVDPLIARAFGRDAIAVVAKQDGRLRFAQITGEDQNPVLDEAAKRQGNDAGTIAKLEADLASAKTESERVQLREQLRQLRLDVQNAQATTAQSEAKLQRTPMTFDYAGGGAGARGFGGENPAREAWYMFVDSLAAMIGFALKALAVLIPWLLLIALLVALTRTRLFRPVRRWWHRNEAPAAASESLPTEHAAGDTSVG